MVDPSTVREKVAEQNIWRQQYDRNVLILLVEKHTGLSNQKINHVDTWTNTIVISYYERCFMGSLLGEDEIYISKKDYRSTSLEYLL